MRALLLLCPVLLLAGCPGSIEDPLQFRNGGGGGGGGGGGACPDDFEVEADLFAKTCASLGCHTGGDVAAAGLDLAAPGVGARMLAHRSQLCGDVPLIDRGDVQSSYFVAKLGDDPPCGDRMPSGGGALNATEQACLNEYLGELVAQAGDAALPPPVDGGVIGGGPDAGSPPEEDAGPSPMPITVEAESMVLDGYVVDPVHTGGIRIPDGASEGSASWTFDGVAGRYALRVHARAENDGQSTLTIRVGDAQIATETFPLGAADVEPVVLGPYALDLAPGDVLVLDAQVGGPTWARLDRLELTP